MGGGGSCSALFPPALADAVDELVREPFDFVDSPSFCALPLTYLTILSSFVLLHCNLLVVLQANVSAHSITTRTD